MKTLLKGVVVAASLSAAGCASIISDSSYPVAINSSPDDAKFKIIDMDTGVTVMKGTTPATVTLKASSGFFDRANYQVVFDKQGYENQVYTLESSIDGWYFGNLLFGGILGFLIVDPATGAMWSLDESLMVSMSRSDETADIDDHNNSLSVMTLDQVPDELREKMVRIN